MPDDTFRPTGDDRWISTDDDRWAGSGTVCWGHVASVVEANARPFFSNWSGTGDVSATQGNDETLTLADGEYMESETWNIGSGVVRLAANKYASGTGSAAIKYIQASLAASCEATPISWNTYSTPFACDGWIKIRVENAVD